MPKFRQHKPPKVKKPKPVKIPRPKVKDLRMVLKGLLTVSQSNRIAALAYALQWYDQALPYLVQKGQLDAKAKKLLEWAVKCRKQGIGATIDNEKETAFLTALRQYEKACTSIKPCGVDKFYDQFKAKQTSLEVKQQRMENKFGNVTGLLQKAIGDRVKLQVADAKKPFQYDPALTSLTYNREAAKALALKFRQEGLLAVLVDQMDILAQHVALEPDGKGGWQYDPAKHVGIVSEMMQSFIKFAKTAEAPKRLVRVGVVAAPKAPKAPCANCNGTGFLPDGTACACAAPKPQVPRGPRTSSPRPTIDGMDVPGSRKRAEMCFMVYDRIKDGQTHLLADVLQGVDTPSRIGQLDRYGKLWGRFNITVNKDKVVLKKVQP